MKAETLALLSRIVPACFFGTWIILILGGIVLLHVCEDVPFKRRWFPRYTILAVVIFNLFATTMAVLASGWSSGLSVTALIAPMMVLITYLNIRGTKFCDGCGATAYNQFWFSRMKFCPDCGAALDPKPKPKDDLFE